MLPVLSKQQGILPGRLNRQPQLGRGACFHPPRKHRWGRGGCHSLRSYRHEEINLLSKIELLSPLLLFSRVPLAPASLGLPPGCLLLRPGLVCLHHWPHTHSPSHTATQSPGFPQGLSLGLNTVGSSPSSQLLWSCSLMLKSYLPLWSELAVFPGYSALFLCCPLAD